MTRCSVLVAVAGSGAAPAFSAWTPRCTSNVASPPSSRIMLAKVPSGQRRICWVHHQYSSRLSPFQANTGTPEGASCVPSGPTATAAAAWSWVEKMLHEAQRTSAPSATRVSMSTAVCTVMCREPAIRAPDSGLLSPYRSRIAIRPGISCSASWISVRPKSADARSATLKSMLVTLPGAIDVRFDIDEPRDGLHGTDRRLGVVDDLGDPFRIRATRDADLDRHEEVIGPEVECPHVDEPVDPVRRGDGVRDAALGLDARRLPHEQRLHLDREDGRDRHQQRTDQCRA